MTDKFAKDKQETSIYKKHAHEESVYEKSTQQSADKITLSPIQDSEDLYEEPYKILSIEIDEWSTAVIHETMIPISVLYHPTITGRLHVLVLQDYVSWAHMNKKKFEKEHAERKRKGQELNLAVASEYEQELDNQESNEQGSDNQESNEQGSDEQELDEQKLEDQESGEHKKSTPTHTEDA